MNGTRWHLSGNGIGWSWQGDDHTDTIEMSGNKVSAIITYGAQSGKLILKRELRYPELRTLPKNTHSTLCVNSDVMQSFTLDGKHVEEIPVGFAFDGILRIDSRDGDGKISISRALFPCCGIRAYAEHTVVTNTSGGAVEFVCDEIRGRQFSRGSKGVYPVNTDCRPVSVTLLPGQSVVCDLIFSAYLNGEAEVTVDGGYEEAKRGLLVKTLFDDSLVLETGDMELDCMFRFSKLRAQESIFDTASGALHSPGGGAYYAAVWTNDQLEYAAPFFAFTGYERAVTASLNAFSLYLPFMGDDLYRIPTSIIDEGNDIWEGAGDRGDAAMYLYGLTRFLLTCGDRETAVKYRPAIDWCVRYCRSRLNSDGVIASDSDELEGRFPAGDANLNTSCLAYAGLLSAADIMRDAGEAEKEREYLSFADALRKNINDFFGAVVSGFDTYRYYRENTKLRSWICTPLTVGIDEKKEGTAAALLSDRLFGSDGLFSEEGSTTFWDRSTLYALRGILNAGYSDRVYGFLRHYVRTRLLSEHVPYPVEAYPEGNMRHLSAESALFCRVITEGFFGIVPRGFRSFELHPSVPSELSVISLKNIRAFCDCFDITLEHENGGYRIKVKKADGRSMEYFAFAGEGVTVELSGF